MRSMILTLLAVAGLALGQNNTTGNSTSSSSSGMVQVIQVGAEENSPGGIFQFIPPTVTAPNGTTVVFNFTGAPGNHSVTQSSFADPCTPLNTTGGGFDSGWVFISGPDAIASGTPTFNITITNDQTPIWFFCQQLVPSPHCITGMVGAINPPASGNTFTKFMTAAKAFKGDVSQADNGQLTGPGASASAGVGNVPTGVTLFGAQASATSPANGSGTGGAGGNGTAGSAGGSASANAPTLLMLGVALVAGVFFT